VQGEAPPIPSHGASDLHSNGVATPTSAISRSLQQAGTAAAADAFESTGLWLNWTASAAESLALLIASASPGGEAVTAVGATTSMAGRAFLPAALDESGVSVGIDAIVGSTGGGPFMHHSLLDLDNCLQQLTSAAGAASGNSLPLPSSFDESLQRSLSCPSSVSGGEL
jgi:hypothetical protein